MTVTRGNPPQRRTIAVSLEIAYWLKGLVLRREQQTGRTFTYDDVIREMLAARDDNEPLLFPDLTADELNGEVPSEHGISAEIPESAS